MRCFLGLQERRSFVSGLDDITPRDKNDGEKEDIKI